ncbi:MAG: gamma carbonic anhydrase family protein [Lachnospiraceae bacterium]|jgi:carbonic anhydrase/acetyltransferase-like protein (isoleucine patch superfamily)
MKAVGMKRISGSYIAPSAELIGNVAVGEDSSVWYKAVLRGDEDDIIIGKETNIQDMCVLHPDKEYPVVIGDGVTVGHGAIIHGCRIDDHTLIGMGAIVMTGAKIGKGCIIGAGSVVTQGTVIPDGMLVYGNPAELRRPVTRDEIEKNVMSAQVYKVNCREHFDRQP